MIGAVVSSEAAPLLALALGVAWRGRLWAWGLGLPLARPRRLAVPPPLAEEDTAPSRVPILPGPAVAEPPRLLLGRIAWALLLVALGFALGRWGGR